MWKAKPRTTNKKTEQNKKKPTIKGCDKKSMESNGDQKPKTDMHTSKGQTKVGVGLNKNKKMKQ
jgi:hypothetical protein